MRQACLWRNTKLHYLPPPLLRRRTIRYGRRDPLCALPLQVILIILDFVRGIVFFSMNLQEGAADAVAAPGRCWRCRRDSAAPEAQYRGHGAQHTRLQGVRGLDTAETDDGVVAQAQSLLNRRGRSRDT